jgi:hypothetical protein
LVPVEHLQPQRRPRPKEIEDKGGERERERERDAAGGEYTAGAKNKP